MLNRTSRYLELPSSKRDSVCDVCSTYGEDWKVVLRVAARILGRQIL